MKLDWPCIVLVGRCEFILWWCTFIFSICLTSKLFLVRLLFDEVDLLTEALLACSGLLSPPAVGAGPLLPV